MIIPTKTPILTAKRLLGNHRFHCRMPPRSATLMWPRMLNHYYYRSHVMSLTNERKKYLKQLGHSLKPVVTVASKGVSETVLQELNRALEDHELIKVKLNVDDKPATIQAVCASAEAELVQSIGNVLLIFRAAKKPNPKLSNLLKNQA